LRSRDGIRLHRREIDPAETRVVDGLALTSPAQTLFDLATVLGTAALAKAANEAFVQGLVTMDGLRATRARNAGRKGAAAFDRVLGLLDPRGRRIRSPLESRLNEFLRARRFPPWEQNVRLVIDGEVIEPDVLWRRQQVIVEADGRGPHLAPLTFASDRRRDRRVRVAGFEPVRVTEVDLDDRPDELEADLKTLLTRAEARNAQKAASDAG
jgi:very-short-patch-repair endonuclease